MEAAAVGDVLLREQLIDLLEAFAKARERFVGRDAEAAEFVRQKRAREADVEPAAADAVEHRDFAGELERVVENRQHGTGDEPCFRRAHRGGGKKDDRVGTVAAVVVKIMFDDAHVRVADAIGRFGDSQAVAEVVRRRFLFGLDVGEELNAELHGLSPGRRQKRVSNS